MIQIYDCDLASVIVHNSSNSNILYLNLLNIDYGNITLVLTGKSNYTYFHFEAPYVFQTVFQIYFQSKFRNTVIVFVLSILLYFVSYYPLEAFFLNKRCKDFWILMGSHAGGTGRIRRENHN